MKVKPGGKVARMVGNSTTGGWRLKDMVMRLIIEEIRIIIRVRLELRSGII